LKIKILIGIITLNSIAFSTEETYEWIENEMSANMFGRTETYYKIKGKDEECQVTYLDNEVLTDTTCSTLTDKNGLITYCTKNRTICKEKKEIDNFVNPRTKSDAISKASVVLKDWNKAHNHRNMKLLSKIYSSELTYYGKKLTRKQCIKDKKRALRKYPDFYQHIEEINYSKITPNLYKVTFTKFVRLTISGETTLYPSYLVIDTSTSSILVEGDDVTDKNIKVKDITKKQVKNTENDKKYEEVNQYQNNYSNIEVKEIETTKVIKKDNTSHIEQESNLEGSFLCKKIQQKALNALEYASKLQKEKKILSSMKQYKKASKSLDDVLDICSDLTDKTRLRYMLLQDISLRASKGY